MKKRESQDPVVGQDAFQVLGKNFESVGHNFKTFFDDIKSGKFFEKLSTVFNTVAERIGQGLDMLSGNDSKAPVAAQPAVTVAQAPSPPMPGV